MNRTLLLIICDFLLISMLALVRFDEPEEAEPEPQPAADLEEGAQEDMVELLRLSLEQEASAQQALREELAERAAALEEREAALSETSQNLEQTSGELERTRREREQLAREREQLAAQREELASQYQAAQSTLQQSEQERERVAQQAQQLQSELQQRQQALRDAEQNLSSLEERARQLQQAQSELETNLQISETEKAMLRENLTAAQAQVETARVERQQAERRAESLASNVGELAQRSSEITEEIRRAQPISSNEIYRRFEANRIQLSFTARVDALFGTREERGAVNAVLVRSQGQTFALFESGQTPLSLDTLNRVNEAQTSFRLGGRNFEVVELSYLAVDPRIAAVQIPDQYLEGTDLRPFELPQEPLRFPEAVLIRSDANNYGEAPFKLMPGGQRYISVPDSIFGQLVRNDFGASRGDYIFAKTGRLMGVMVSGRRGAILSDLQPAAQLPLGNSFRADRADTLHERLTRQLPVD